jgi:hypothetical protein
VKKLNDCIGDEVKNAVAEAKEGEVRAEGQDRTQSHLHLPGMRSGAAGLIKSTAAAILMLCAANLSMHQSLGAGLDTQQQHSPQACQHAVASSQRIKRTPLGTHTWIADWVCQSPSAGLHNSIACAAPAFMCNLNWAVLGVASAHAVRPARAVTAETP